MEDASRDPARHGHILRELGFVVERRDDHRHGVATVTAHMHVPGTTSLRSSIVAAWVDIVTGLECVDVIGPRVPVTLELDVDLYGPLPGDGEIHVVARLVKAGRSVMVARADVTDGDGRALAIGTGVFMAAPDPSVSMPSDVDRLVMQQPVDRLAVPFAERAGCERREPGIAILRRSDEGLNASGTVNGGLLALAVEEAALSAAPAGATLSSMALRYLRAVRVGPAVARAERNGHVAVVELRDAGRDGDLAILATTHVA